MQLILQFDVDADIIDVPKKVIEDRDLMRKKFLRWIYNRRNKHIYWIAIPGPSGNKNMGVCFGGDAFVEWLNLNVLSEYEEKSIVLESHISDPPANIPVLFF